MLIIPAIDLYQGKVVRLTKGDPEKSKVYNTDPVAVAKDWQAQGAELIHLVDLSAALGEGDNREVIKRILKETKVKIEVGGGIRDIARAEEIISWGADKVIIGTRVLDEDFLNSLVEAIGKEKIAAGIDAIDSVIAIEGWKKKTDFNALDFVAYLQLKGIKRIIYTDISRDGTLEGLDLGKVEKLATFKDLDIILSGGVSSLADIEKVKQQVPFIWGLIVGKALYEGRFSLAEAKKLL